MNTLVAESPILAERQNTSADRRILHNGNGNSNGSNGYGTTRLSSPLADDAAEDELPPAPFLWTREQYHQLGELGVFDGVRVELINGEIVVMSPIRERHWVATNLAARALNRVFPTDTYTVSVQSSIGLGRKSEPEPDIAVVIGDPRQYIDGIPESAALVVEVAMSSLIYDRLTKSALYARAGVPEYWIVNLQDNVLEVRREPNTETGEYAVKFTLTKEDIVTALEKPGDIITVAELLP